MDSQTAASSTSKPRWYQAMYRRICADIAQRVATKLPKLIAPVVDKAVEKINTLAAQQRQDQTAMLIRTIKETADQKAALLEATLAQAIAVEAHRNAAYLDGALAGLVATSIAAHAAEIITALADHLSRVLSDQEQHLATGLHQQMSHVDSHLSEHFTKQLSLQSVLSGIPPAADPAILQQRALTLGALLEPMRVDGYKKLRVGHEQDGGYVMLDDFARNRFALSLGVGAEITWDLAIAERGLDVHQFDHTIEAPPGTDPRLHFHRVRIASTDGDGASSLASARQFGGDGLCIVKMDIEGDEWNVLHDVAAGEFTHVTQLICEFHDFDKIADAAWFERADTVLRRLAKDFGVVHVHANNYGALRLQGNISFPEILEVTFANKAFFELLETQDVFPTTLDRPNRPDLPDIFLGTFHFATSP